MSKFSYKNSKIKYKKVSGKVNEYIYFLHGIGDTSESFSVLSKELHDLGYTIILIDLPGFGENKNCLITNFEELLYFLEYFIKKTKYRSNKIYLIGHSMGGLICLLMASIMNNYFEQIITIEPSVTNPDYDFFKYVGSIEFEKFRENIKRSNFKYAEEYHKNLSKCNKQVFINIVKDINEKFLSFQKRILEVNIRYNYIYGANSTEICKREEFFRNTKAILFKIDDAEHWVHIDNHDKCLEIIKKILGVDKNEL